MSAAAAMIVHVCNIIFNLKPLFAILTGVPLPVVVVWAIVKAYGFEYAPGTELLSDDSQLMTTHHHHNNNKVGNSLESFLSNCPWMAANSYDWIYMAPAIVVLFVNILFLIKIMWVSNNNIFPHSRNEKINL
jgi:hypothetical protein